METKKTYQEIRRSYDICIRVTRNERWKNFINESARNPWGFAYKFSANKLKTQNVMNSIIDSGGETLNWREAAEKLMNTLFIGDKEEEDTLEQKEIRNAMDNLDNLEETPENKFTRKEIETTIKNLSDGKAPAWDKMEVVIFKKASTIIMEALESLYNGCLTYGIIPNDWKKAEKT